MLFKKVNMIDDCHYGKNADTDNMFPVENNFLKFLAYGKDNKQKCRVIKYINISQYNLLKKIALQILNGVIPLKKFQLDYLKQSKNFLRKLSTKKIKVVELGRHFRSICYIVKIALEYYEVHTKTSFSSNRKVGKNRRQRSCETSDSESSSSENSNSSLEEYYSSSGESEKSEKIRKDEESENISNVSFSVSEEEN